MITMERLVVKGFFSDSPQKRHRSASSSLIGLWQCGHKRSMQIFYHYTQKSNHFLMVAHLTYQPMR